MFNILKNNVLLRFIYIYIAIFISFNSNAQIQKSDTIIFNDTITKIFTVTNKGGYSKYILGSDTFIQKDNSLYYRYVVDSIRKTKEYLNREKINTNIDMLYVDIESSYRGSWSATSFHIYIYYNQRVMENPKGIVLYNDLLNKNKLIGFIDDDIFSSIVKILDDNMALNHKIDQNYLLEDMIITTASIKRVIKLKLKKDNQFFENSFSVNECSYGFGKTAFYDIMRLGLKIATDNKQNDFYNFINKNKKAIGEDEYILEMIYQFENN